MPDLTTPATRSRSELTSLELAARIEAKTNLAGNAIGRAMTEIGRGCADEDVIETLHEAMNALQVALLDADFIQENLK